MTSITDLYINHIKKFLEKNSVIPSKSTKEIYDEAFNLMKKNNTNYDEVDISIIEWMLAYNAIKNNEINETYHIDDIISMTDSQRNELAKSLGMKGNNIDNVVNILRFMHKLNSDINLLPEFKTKDFEQDLNRELLHTKIVNKKYFSTEILDLKKDDRLTDGDFNYKVISANKNKVTVQKVDILGNPSGNKTPISIKKVQYHRRGVGYSNKFYWVIADKKLIPGLLLYDYGPKIDSIDSIYLKYKTLLITSPNM